jgi:hypothetical protein
MEKINILNQRNGRRWKNGWGKSVPRRQFLIGGKTFRFSTGTHQFGASLFFVGDNGSLKGAFKWKGKHRFTKRM